MTHCERMEPITATDERKCQCTLTGTGLFSMALALAAARARPVSNKFVFYGSDGGAGQEWSGLMIFTISVTKFQTPIRSTLELTMTTIVVRSGGR